MKIDSMFFGRNVTTKKDVAKNEANASNNKRISKSFDAVIINAKNIQSDESFANEISSKILNDIKTTSSEERILKVKEQIENGTFKPSIEELASKIMFLG